VPPGQRTASRDSTNDFVNLLSKSASLDQVMDGPNFQQTHTIFHRKKTKGNKQTFLSPVEPEQQENKEQVTDIPLGIRAIRILRCT
jgi:hypothetical protein